MRVINNGKLDTEVRCVTCNAVYEYDFYDIENFGNNLNGYVSCPECGTKKVITVEKINYVKECMLANEVGDVGLMQRMMDCNIVIVNGVVIKNRYGRYCVMDSIDVTDINESNSDVMYDENKVLVIDTL